MNEVDIINSLIGSDVSLLNEHERKVRFLIDFENEVVNGGWDQYLWNSSGNNAGELVQVVHEFGYTEIETALAKIRDAMDGVIPGGRSERIEKLEKLRESITEEEDDHISDLIGRDLDKIFDDLIRYIDNNLSFFNRK